MKLAIFDLEMNQPSGTIIQIGAVVVDTNKMTIGDTYSLVCNPGEVPSDFITNLTGITRGSVREAPTAHSAITNFWKWLKTAECGNKLGAWGNDFKDIRNASSYYKISYDWPKFFNIKDFVAMYTHIKDDQQSYKMGLKQACEFWGIKYDKEKAHDALWDAMKTAEVFMAVCKSVNREKVT